MQMEKVTISLPREIVLLADQVAKERQVSRSKVISSCLEEFAQRRLLEEMEEGYRAISRENLDFATLVIETAHEIVPEWEPGDDEK